MKAFMPIPQTIKYLQVVPMGRNKNKDWEEEK